MKKNLALTLVLALVMSLCAFGVGAVEYTEWTDATTLPTEGTYKLTVDVTVDAFAGVSIMSGKAVTLDLNGHTVTVNNGYYYVRSGGSLVIEDSVGTGKIVNVGSTMAAIYANGSGASVEIKGGTVENQKGSAYALYLNAGANGVLTAGTIKNSHANSGRAVYVNGASTFTMNGGSVVSIPNGDSAAIQGNGSGAITVNGGEITAGTMGVGGIAISSSSNPVTVTGGDIEAGKNALQTRYATVEPAEGKEVNITAGAAVLAPYSAPSTGDGNVIKGGNFEAPALASGSNAQNTVVSGGSFTTPADPATGAAAGAMQIPAENLAPGAETDPNTGVVCTHSNTELKNAVAAQVGVAGYTGDLVCSDCGKTVEPGEDIPALPAPTPTPTPTPSNPTPSRPNPSTGVKY